jgi:hypothetical protein
MAQAIRSGSLAVYSQADTNTSRTVSAGSGWASGDVLVAIACADNTTIALPSGWTPFGLAGTAGLLNWCAGYVVRGGSNPNLTFTVGTASNRYVEIYIIALTGVDNSNPISGSIGYDATGNAAANSSTFPNPPSTNVGTNALILIAGAKYAGAATSSDWTHPVYTTLNTVDEGFIGFAYSPTLLSGTQDPAAFANGAAGTTGLTNGFTVGFAAAASETITPDKWLGRQEAQYRPKTQVVPSGTIGIKAQRERELWREAARLEALSTDLRRAA